MSGTLIIQPAGRRKILRSIIFLTGILSIVIFIAARFLPQRLNAGNSTNRKVVEELTGIAPPPSVSPCGIASYRYMSAQLTFIRLSGSLPDCLKYAQQITMASRLSPVTLSQAQLDSQLIKNGNVLIGDVSWFDLPYSVDGWKSINGKRVFECQEYQGNCWPNMLGADTESREGRVTSVRVDTQHQTLYIIQAK